MYCVVLKNDEYVLGKEFKVVNGKSFIVTESGEKLFSFIKPFKKELTAEDLKGEGVFSREEIVGLQKAIVKFKMSYLSKNLMSEIYDKLLYTPNIAHQFTIFKVDEQAVEYVDLKETAISVLNNIKEVVENNIDFELDTLKEILIEDIINQDYTSKKEDFYMYLKILLKVFKESVD